MQGAGDGGKVPDESPVIGGQAKEAAQFRDVVGEGPVPHRGHLLRFSGHPPLH